MNTRPLLTLTLGFLAGGAVAGCDTSTPIGDLGPTGAGGTSPKVIPPGQAQFVPSPDRVLNDTPFTNPSGISGDWVGYFENYEQYGHPGLDAVRLRFAVDGQGQNTLTVVRGTGTPPPPPTDAYEAWPEPVVTAQNSPGPGFLYPVGLPVAGYAYAAHQVTWQASRLKFRLADAEPWSTWCRLQTSYLHPGTGGGTAFYDCNAGNGASSDGMTCSYPDAPTARCSPNNLMMCGPGTGFCDCNATGCGPSNYFGTSYDLTFSGDTADGSSGPYRVRLTRAAP